MDTAINKVPSFMTFQGNGGKIKMKCQMVVNAVKNNISGHHPPMCSIATVSVSLWSTVVHKWKTLEISDL